MALNLIEQLLLRGIPAVLIDRKGDLCGYARAEVWSRFLGDQANVEFWVAQLLLELSRWMSRNSLSNLQGVVLFDEADMYLPAQRKPATKEPMENLLRRARSAGLGLFLATQSPGDFDYRCRDNIRTWFLGRIKEKPALEKMKPMLNDCRAPVADKLPTQQTGEFVLARDGVVQSLHADPSFLKTEQVEEQEILRLARRTVLQTENQVISNRG